MAKRQFWLVKDEVRANAIAAIREAEHNSRVVVFDPARSIPQNDRLHAMCDDISRQVEWRDMFNRPIRMSPERWKRFFAAMWVRSHGGSSTVVPNEDGSGFYDLSVSTTELKVSEASDLMELISAFGAERNVQWSEPGDPRERKPKSKPEAEAASRSKVDAR
jgi:hypothetical protein